MKKTIKILVCYHKPFPLLKDEILTPIHLGRKIANKENTGVQWLMENMIGDDTGENISDKNAYYNEMTALYWAWKNYDKLGNPDYIGLAHYRRLFVMEENVSETYSIKEYNQNNIKEVLNYTPEKLKKIVEDCDFVTHLGQVYNLYQHYVDNQRKADIDIAMEILEKRYPEYKETADAYMAGQISNFYNMNIFSREIFFEYCEFVFSIMEEFEKRVPSVLNRRMFISERLTAIFVKKLMDSGKYKFKTLPVAFMEESLDVNVAAYVSNDNVRALSVSLQSILEYVNDFNKYVFYLVQDGNLKKEYVDILKSMIEKNDNCVLKLVTYGKNIENLPLEISFILSELNKCLLISEAVVALTDIAEFYRLCVVDDFFVSGIPEIKYDQLDLEKRIVRDMMVLNCKRIRANSNKYKKKLLENKEGGMSTLNNCWNGEIKYIAYYWYVSERLFMLEAHVYGKEKSRGQMQMEAKWCPIVLFDNVNPLINSQGIYAKFWWDVFQKLPKEMKQMEYEDSFLKRIWKRQLDEIWLKENCGVVSYEPEYHESEYHESEYHEPYVEEANLKELVEPQPVEPKSVQTETEDWRSYGLWGKLKFYYKHNGMKNTIKYAKIKIFGRKEK